MKIDTETNRKNAKYPRSVMIKRVLWALIKPLFIFSPRIFFGWRRFLLRLLGARIGEHVNIYNNAHIYFPWNLEVGSWSAIGENVYIYNLGSICIGNNVTISQRAHLCAGTHDHTDVTLPLLKPPIVIENQAWVCADAFIGPGVTVGEGAVVGARAVAMRDVEPWQIVVGNPAVAVSRRVMGENPDQACAD